MSVVAPQGSDTPSPSTRPKVAVILLGRRGGSTLREATAKLAGAADAFGFEVCAVVPAGTDVAADLTELSPRVRVLPVERGTPESSWRAAAIAASDADLLEFVDDEAAAARPWDELSPYRLGLVRVGGGAPADLGAALERLRVPVPPEGGTGR